MRKIYIVLIAALSIFTACSDVTLPDSASDAKTTVNGLSYFNPQGTRQLACPPLLNWNPLLHLNRVYFFLLF